MSAAYLDSNDPKKSQRKSCQANQESFRSPLSFMKAKTLKFLLRHLCYITSFRNSLNTLRTDIFSFVSALLYNTLHASVVGLLSHNFFIVTFTQQKK